MITRRKFVAGVTSVMALLGFGVQEARANPVGDEHYLKGVKCPFPDCKGKICKWELGELVWASPLATRQAGGVWEVAYLCCENGHKIAASEKPPVSQLYRYTSYKL